MRFNNICSPSELSGQGLVLQVYRQKEKSTASVELKTFTLWRIILETYTNVLIEKRGGAIYIYDAGILIK